MRSFTSFSPILPSALGIIIGIVALLCCSPWLAMVPMALAVAFYLSKKEWWATVAAFVAIGMLVATIMSPNEPPKSLFGQKLHYSASIITVKETQQACILTLEIDSVQHRAIRKFTAQLTINALNDSFCRGQRIAFVSSLTSPASDPILPGDVDLTLYYKSEGIMALAYCTPDQAVITVPAEGITADFEHARQQIASAIVSSRLSPDCSAFMLAALLGDDQLLPTSTNLAFRRTGISHILALSGLHVGIILTIAMFLTIPLNLHRSGIYARPILAIVFVWLYAMLVGMPASVVRASVMTTVYMLSRMIQRGHTGFNSLLISIVVILIIKPLWLFSVGFQLSVCAVASILAFTSLIPNRWQRHPLRYYLLMLLVIPIAAMLGTGLISAIHFSTFPVYFLPANLLVGLITPWLLGLGVIVAIFSLIGWHVVISSWIANGLYTILATTATWLSHLPNAQIHGIAVHALAVIPYAIALICLWLAIYKKSWTWGGASAGCLAITTMLALINQTPKPSAELYILPDTNSTKIILTTHNPLPQLLLPDASPDTVEALAMVNRLHQGYFNLRADSTPPLTGPTPQYITIDGITLRFLFDTNDTTPSTPRPTYLLVSKGFKGHISKHWHTIRPDTILLSPALHPKIARRLLAECADTIPIINLRMRRFKIIQP